VAWMGTHGVRNHEGIWKLSRFYSIGFGRLICKKHCSRVCTHVWTCPASSSARTYACQVEMVSLLIISCVLGECTQQM